MLSPAKIEEKLEALRTYQFREGFCFICGEKLNEESSTGVLHYDCAHAYNDIKESVVNKIFEKMENAS